MMITRKISLNEHSVALMKGKVYVVNAKEDNSSMVHTLQANLMSYRFMLSEKAFAALVGAPKEHIRNLYQSTLGYVRDFIGDGNYRPIYQNFPTELMSKKDCSSFWSYITHYWNNGNWPSETVLERPITFESIKYNVLDVIDDDGLDKIFTDIVSVNQSLTDADKAVVEWFIQSGRTLKIPEVIPFKENLCLLAGMGVKGLPIKTSTDVLRIAVFLSGGDISLPAVPKKPKTTSKWFKPVHTPDMDKFKFKHFKRSERRYLLELLEQSNIDAREMVSKDQRWIRLGEILHPGQYAARFPKTFKAFNSLRSEKVRSWNSTLNATLAKDLKEGLKFLSQRPGEFVRRMDWLIRTHQHTTNLNLVLDAFSGCAQGASNKVLFELINHFDRRTDAVKNRSIMIKGARKRTPLPDLPAIKKEAIDNVQKTILNVLVEKFKILTPFGKTWIDPELKKIPLPTNMRSMNWSLKPIIRGQRIPFENQSAAVIRAYVHWIDKMGSIDIDLSATFVSKSGVEVLSYSNLRVGQSCHSGDVIARKGNCAEYIDVDIADARKSGVQYIVLDVRNFRGGTLASVDCTCGYMEREFAESNSIWLPETVTGSQKLESASSVTLVSILDIQNMEYIHLDIDSAGTTYARGDIKTTLETIKQYAEMPKFSVGHLLEMHTVARGQWTDKKEEAQTIFEYSDFCNDYIAVAQYMGV
jgi:hypothetical protein